ncbi:MAG TPA: transaldolase [Planctomycetota bacterium]|nr:transaldolase [Planctomycetota bacterium]
MTRTAKSSTTPTARLHALGQSLWLDAISRELLDSGTLETYLADLSVTGLTSNPTIFQQAISSGAAYERPARDLRERGVTGEALVFELALDDIRAAADLLLSTWERTAGADGWVSLEVSPRLANDTAGSLAAARELHTRAGRHNVMIKIPGTAAGLPAIEEATFAGVPINVTLLFSREQYLAAAEAWMRGIERRIAAGLRADVTSVASVFVSRWDKAVHQQVPAALRNTLGIAMARRCYAASRELQDSTRWLAAANSGARPQRLLWGSTGTKDPAARDTLYVEALAAPLTVNTMPEATLKAFADHGTLGSALPADGGDCEAVIARFVQAGVDVDALAARLQTEGVSAFEASWASLLDALENPVPRPSRREEASR